MCSWISKIANNYMVELYVCSIVLHEDFREWYFKYKTCAKLYVYGNNYHRMPPQSFSSDVPRLEMLDNDGELPGLLYQKLRVQYYCATCTFLVCLSNSSEKPGNSSEWVTRSLNVSPWIERFENSIEPHLWESVQRYPEKNPKSLEENYFGTQENSFCVQSIRPVCSNQGYR